jgi:hypothetical protein
VGGVERGTAAAHDGVERGTAMADDGVKRGTAVADDEVEHGKAVGDDVERGAAASAAVPRRRRAHVGSGCQAAASARGHWLPLARRRPRVVGGGLACSRRGRRTRLLIGGRRPLLDGDSALVVSLRSWGVGRGGCFCFLNGHAGGD